MEWEIQNMRRRLTLLFGAQQENVDLRHLVLKGFELIVIKRLYLLVLHVHVAKNLWIYPVSLFTGVGLCWMVVFSLIPVKFPQNNFPTQL
jgi:hypothetical protein